MLAALGETPVLAGYCLGGTIAAATCELMDVSGLVMIAAPWNFAAFPQQSREKIIGLWRRPNLSANDWAMFLWKFYNRVSGHLIQREPFGNMQRSLICRKNPMRLRGSSDWRIGRMKVRR